jgi:DNA-binding transcriptional MerR regulator
MLMAQLSRSSGVPIATIKYYLREGLLPPGSAISATRAEYDGTHLRRLRLIRALVEIGEIPVAAIRTILGVVDDESASVHAMLGTVQYQLGPHPAGPAEDDPDWQAACREVDALIADRGWRIAPQAPARLLLAATLAALRRTESAPPGAGKSPASASPLVYLGRLKPTPAHPGSRSPSQPSWAWSCTSGSSSPCVASPRKTPRLVTSDRAQRRLAPMPS